MWHMAFPICHTSNITYDMMRYDTIWVVVPYYDMVRYGNSTYDLLRYDKIQCNVIPAPSEYSIRRCKIECIETRSDTYAVAEPYYY